VRRIGFGPVHFKGVPGLVYSAYMPEANGCTYCWCDSTIPLGREPMHCEMAAVYRNLPAGHYREADRKDGVFARVLNAARPAFYVVNTTGGIAELELRTGCSGAFVDPVAGQAIRVAGGKQLFRLQPYECKVFLPKKE
jgi:hypothetical protein